MEQNGISKLDVKRRNRMQILKYIRYHGPQSRIDISVRLQLTRAAVTIITNEMIAQGVIYEKGEEAFEAKKNTRGRRKVLLDISRNYKLVFGVAVEKNRVMVGLTNLFGEVLDKNETEIEVKTYIQLLETISEGIKKLVKDNWLTEDKILGIGVCVSDSALEYIEEKNVQSKLVKIGKDLSRAFPYPVTSGKTIDGAALAQADFDKDLTTLPVSVAVVQYGDEIDSTAIIHNKIYSGATGKACGMRKLQHVTDDSSSYKRMKSEIISAYSENNTPYLYEETSGDRQLIDRVFPDYEKCKRDHIIKNILDSTNLKLSTDFYTIATIMDCEKIWVFGDYLDAQSNIEQINSNINKLFDSKFAIESSLVNQNTLFLCGCALAVQEFFVNMGGFDC